MHSFRTFGECLTDLMTVHKLTAASLARMVDIGNAISVKRIMRDEASQKRRDAFLALLTKQRNIFSPNEIEQLTQAAQVSELGKSAYAARMCFENLLFDHSVEPEPYTMLDNGDTLEAFFSKLPTKDPLQLLCMSCCDSAIFTALAPLFNDPKRVLDVKHYVCIQDDSPTITQYIQAIKPIMFESRYHLYVSSRAVNGSDALLFAPFVMFIKSGIGPRASEQLLLFRNDRKVATLTNLQRVSMLDDISRMLNSLEPKPVAISTPSRTLNVTSFRDYLFSCYQQEKNRAVYQLKPDPCQEMFPPEILKAAALTDADEATKNELVREIFPIVNGRYMNIMKKAKPTYHIHGYEATAQFFQTGILKDQFAWLRPFTVEERRQIADTLLDAAEHNPRYHLHFLKPPYKQGTLQFIYCEGLGVLVCPTATHYDVMHEVCEMLVTSATFCSEYKSFFSDVLLKEYVYSKEESMNMLQKIRNHL